MVKISIIIPAHNEEQRIKECINSVIKQDFNDFEIIVIDDGSTDRTYDILKEMKNKSIKIIRNKAGSSAAHARNQGVRVSKGKYLYFLDADNKLVNKNFLSKLFYVYEKYNAGAVLSNSCNWSTTLFTRISGANIQIIKSKERLIKHNKEEINKTIIFSYRREVFINLGMFDEESFYWEDTLLTEKYAELNLPTYRILDNFMAIEPPNSISGFIKQSKSIGKGISKLKDDNYRRKKVALTYFKFLIFCLVPLALLILALTTGFYPLFISYLIILILFSILRTKSNNLLVSLAYSLLFFVKVFFITYGLSKNMKRF